MIKLKIDEKARITRERLLKELNKDYENAKWYQKLFKRKHEMDPVTKVYFRYAYSKGYHDGENEMFDYVVKKLTLSEDME